VLLLASGQVELNRSDAFAFFIAVFLGPLIGLAGAFFDARRGQPLGLLLLALGILLALDGAVSTGLVSPPSLLQILVSLLILLSLVAGIMGRRNPTRSRARER